MSPDYDDIAAFWDLYFRNQFVQLERNANGYRGLAYADPASAAPPAGFFRKRELRVIEIAFDRLRQWDYRADLRFDLILKRPTTMAEAIDRVIERNYPYRDPAPFGKERMAELGGVLRTQFQQAGHNSAITLELAQHVLVKMIAEHTQALDQPIAALAWLLGEQRDRSSAPMLVEVVRNSSYFPFAAHRLHFTPVDAGFSALWKVNGKQVTSELLKIMEGGSESGRRKIAALMERLYSTKELLSLDRCGERYLDPLFWRELIPADRPLSDWDRVDTSAIFWEVRLLALTRLPIQDLNLLEKLANDEVGTVREAAAARLTKVN